MQITKTAFEGVFLVSLDPFTDGRGSFARTFDREFFNDQGLLVDPAQCNVVWNGDRGILRGMHYQAAPDAEAKVVHCLSGEIHDVILDLRPDSETYGQSLAHRLSSADPTLLYIPEGLAHGLQTLVTGTCVYYLMSAAYAPQSERGIRWDDPAFGIDWPLDPPILSEKDRAYADFEL